MSSRVRCSCQSCTIRSFVGPALVITVGVLLLLNEMHGGRFYFGSTWPVILIVIGVLHLASSVASREGHVSCQPGVTTPPTPPAPPTPPSSPASGTQTSFSSQGQ